MSTGYCSLQQEFFFANFLLWPLLRVNGLSTTHDLAQQCGIHPANRGYFCLLLGRGGEKRRLVLNCVKPLNWLQPKLLDQVKLVFSRETGFSSESIRLLMVITDGHTKRRAIRPRFETVSQQHAAHAQERSHSIHADSFASTAKSNKRNKGSADGRVSDIEQTIVIWYSILPGSKIFPLVLRLEVPGLIFPEQNPSQNLKEIIRTFFS